MDVGGVVEVVDHRVEADLEGLKAEGDHCGQDWALSLCEDVVKLVEDEFDHPGGEQPLDDEPGCALGDGLQLEHYLLDQRELVLEVADALRLSDDLGHPLQFAQVFLLVDAQRLGLGLQRLLPVLAQQQLLPQVLHPHQLAQHPQDLLLLPQLALLLPVLPQLVGDQVQPILLRRQFLLDVHRTHQNPR